ncbi:MAG TPA: antitoxin [Desulfobacterales bacterium]
MKTITVRGIDETLAEELKKTAKEEGKSVNQLVLDSIKGRLGIGDERKFTIVYHDMDHLFGKWTQKEFEKIQGKIDAERKIDKELWS